MLRPKLDVLPAAQRALWPALNDIPDSYILYGGTALALRLGHRSSVDFDFFSSETLDSEALFEIPFIADAEVLQRVAARDYLDLAAILRAGVPLQEGLGAAVALYGNEFPPLDAVKALAYFEENVEGQVDTATRRYLTHHASRWDFTVTQVRQTATSLFGS